MMDEHFRDRYELRCSCEDESRPSIELKDVWKAWQVKVDYIRVCPYADLREKLVDAIDKLFTECQDRDVEAYDFAVLCALDDGKSIRRTARDLEVPEMIVKSIIETYIEDNTKGPKSQRWLPPALIQLVNTKKAYKRRLREKQENKSLRFRSPKLLTGAV
jgi:transposase-like protein